MLNTKKQGKGEGKSLCPRFMSGRVFFTLCLLPFTFYLSGCRQDMQDQPRYEVYEPSRNFSDGQSSRPYVEGTVARGYRDVNTAYYTGKNATGGAGGQAAGGGGGGMTPLTSASANVPNAQGASGGGTQTSGDVNVRGNVAGNVPGGGAAGQSGTPGGVNEFPFAITATELNRGQERFDIYCAMCHGQTGYGDGMIVRRGFRRPPSLHDDRLRNETLGHFFDVITNGWGAMPDYSQEIPPRDRWAIIAYIRALQLSQNTPAAEVPENLRNRRKPGPGTPTTEGGHQGTGGERTP
ncbi:MAG TPA: cytochrome c [Pyrinomonadaceae bacterium]|nr:cytochrome c [Pyrinomonadaceae bacterium]